MVAGSITSGPASSATRIQMGFLDSPWRPQSTCATGPGWHIQHVNQPQHNPHQAETASILNLLKPGKPSTLLSLPLPFQNPLTQSFKLSLFLKSLQRNCLQTIRSGSSFQGNKTSSLMVGKNPRPGISHWHSSWAMLSPTLINLFYQISLSQRSKASALLLMLMTSRIYPKYYSQHPSYEVAAPQRQ